MKSNICFFISAPNLMLGAKRMPQPLSRVMPNASVMIGNAGDRPLLRHPELAALAIEAIASWSNVESFMLNMFIQLFGGNETMSANIYLSLENQSAKNAAIRAAADIALKEKPEEHSVFKAIIAISKTNEKSRNKLAHWTWGDSHNITDGVLLIDPRSSIGGLDKSKIYVYKAQDFNAIIQANDKLCGYGLRFSFILNNHIANRDGQLLNELKAEPEIKERLSVIIASNKTL